jgi:site-specific DNA-methyltransferase (cytosine-N4-specific)
MAKTDFPKANNKNILRPYSSSMNDLLKSQSYNSGKRPSEHKISDTGFLTDHGGSIMPNFIEIEPLSDDKELRLPNVVSIANTCSTDFFHRTCRERGIEMHPARMPAGLAGLFIQFLTDPGDLVLDPFAGSNTSGFAAELLGRRWVSIEIMKDYAKQSKVRFEAPMIQTNRREENQQ